MNKEQNMKSKNAILKKIDESKRILITAHINPDGDAIGSSLALFLAINKYLKLNEKIEPVVRIILEDNTPRYLNFLKGIEMVEKFSDINTKYKFDAIIALDCGELSRIGKVEELISEDTTVINIDHHISNNRYGDINLVENVSSTSEILYDLIKNFNIDMDTDIGEALYTGIAFDTGNFSYSNVSDITFHIAAKLTKLGIDNEKISEELFSNKSMKELRLLGLALENMKYYKEEKLNIFYLRKEQYENKEDTEGIVEALRSYEKCKVALFLREEDDGKIKGSFRSKGPDVNKIATMFDGGGHKKAAGFKTDKKYNEILDIVLKNLR
ncbi:MAG: DHH family phosphoesterase [Fusobacteriota bacterium]